MQIMMIEIIDYLVQEGVDVIILTTKVKLLYHQQRRQQHQEIITNPIVVPFYFFSTWIKIDLFCERIIISLLLLFLFFFCCCRRYHCYQLLHFAIIIIIINHCIYMIFCISSPFSLSWNGRLNRHPLFIALVGCITVTIGSMLFLTSLFTPSILYHYYDQAFNDVFVLIHSSVFSIWCWIQSTRIYFASDLT